MKLSIIAFIALLSVLAGCSSEPAVKPTRPVLFVSILPLKQIVERIAQDRFDVIALIGPGESPHTYTPTPSQMVTLAQGRILFRIGVEFEEPLLPKLLSTAPQLRIIDLRAGLSLRQMEESSCDHGHHHHGDGHDGANDPHVWMSPRNATIMAATVRDILATIDATRRSHYFSACSTLTRSLDSADTDFRTAFAPYQGAAFYVFHPSFGYFADAYGLRQVAVEVGGKEPSAQQLARLIDQSKSDGVSVIYSQPQFSERSARSLAEQLGWTVLTLDGLAEDYIGNLYAIKDALILGLGRKRTP